MPTSKDRSAASASTVKIKAQAAKAPARKRVAVKASPSAPAAAAGMDTDAASALIDGKIAALDDWRGATLGRMRALIHAADPGIIEEWKWMGTPVWSHDGIVCTGESYKSIVKLTFAKGASLPDPARLFNSSLDGNVRRAIDICEGEAVDAAAFKALIRAAVALNAAGAAAKAKKKAK